MAHDVSSDLEDDKVDNDYLFASSCGFLDSFLDSEAGLSALTSTEFELGRDGLCDLFRDDNRNDRRSLNSGATQRLQVQIKQHQRTLGDLYEELGVLIKAHARDVYTPEDAAIVGDLCGQVNRNIQSIEGSFDDAGFGSAITHEGFAGPSGLGETVLDAVERYESLRKMLSQFQKIQQANKGTLDVLGQRT